MSNVRDFSEGRTQL